MRPNRHRTNVGPIQSGTLPPPHGIPARRNAVRRWRPATIARNPLHASAPLCDDGIERRQVSRPRSCGSRMYLRSRIHARSSSATRGVVQNPHPLDAFRRDGGRASGGDSPQSRAPASMPNVHALTMTMMHVHSLPPLHHTHEGTNHRSLQLRESVRAHGRIRLPNRCLELGDLCMGCPSDALPRL